MKFQATFFDVLFQTKHLKLMWSYVFLQQYLPLCVAAMFDGGCSESKLSLLTNCGEHGLQNQLLTNPQGVNEIGCYNPPPRTGIPYFPYSPKQWPVQWVLRTIAQK